MNGWGLIIAFLVGIVAGFFVGVIAGYAVADRKVTEAPAPDIFEKE